LFLSAMSNIRACGVEYNLELHVLQATKITDAQKIFWQPLGVGKNASKIADHEVVSKGQL